MKYCSESFSNFAIWPIWCHIFFFLSFVPPFLTVWVSGFQASRLLEHHGSFQAVAFIGDFPSRVLRLGFNKKSSEFPPSKIQLYMYTVLILYLFFDFNFLNNIVAPHLNHPCRLLADPKMGADDQEAR